MQQSKEGETNTHQALDGNPSCFLHLTSSMHLLSQQPLAKSSTVFPCWDVLLPLVSLPG